VLQAVKIALEVKKYLVDNELLDISQARACSLYNMSYCFASHAGARALAMRARAADSCLHKGSVRP
jgi:hypothetical protein